MVSFCVVALGQLPPPAVPVVEADVKQNSIRMRARALEMFRQESKKGSNKNRAIKTENFEQLRKDFEGVQLLQNEIVKIYTTQKKIDFSMLEKRSEKLLESSKRLHKFLFPDLKERFWENPQSYGDATTNLPNSIVKVDNALGRFVDNPMFKERAVLDLAESEKARRELEIIIRYTERVRKISHSNNK